MKVYIFARLDNIWQNGNGKAIYDEAKRQGKDVVLGDVAWDDLKIVSEVQKEKPDWVFITGRNTMRYPPLYQIHHMVKGKIFVYDCDESWTEIHALVWKLLQSWAGVVCSSQKAIVDKYNTIAPIVRWIPQDYDLNMMSPTISTKKEYDIGFLGVGDAHRELLFTKLRKKFNVCAKGGIFGSEVLRGSDMANFYSKCKIVLDTPRAGIACHSGPSDRIYKVLGSGTFFLTYETPGIIDLFKPQYHLDFYESYEHLIEKIVFYLKHEDIREMIAKQGQEEVLNRHTLTHRIPTYWGLMEEFMNIKNIQWPKRF